MEPALTARPLSSITTITTTTSSQAFPYSTDAGATFTEIEPPPFATGHGMNYGDPIVVYNQKLHLWFAGDLVTACGSFGVGLWTSPDGINWTPGGCAVNGSGTDRESMWVDNDPTSAAYGRMYISFNNFTINSGALEVSYSDDGVNWTVVQLSTSFIRDVQITGAQISPTSPPFLAERLQLGFRRRYG